jgi:hypothetical protein
MARGVGIDTKTGAIYVTSDRKEMIALVKFNPSARPGQVGWQDAKPAAEAQFRRKGWTANHSMAVDASASPTECPSQRGSSGFVRPNWDEPASRPNLQPRGTTDWKSPSPSRRPTSQN